MIYHSQLVGKLIEMGYEVTGPPDRGTAIYRRKGSVRLITIPHAQAYLEPTAGIALQMAGLTTDDAIHWVNQASNNNKPSAIL